jgi:hypothetical protein
VANTLTAVTPKLLAQGLLALRQNCMAPQLVNRQYEAMAGMRGSSIDVPIPSAIAAQDVSPSNTPPSTADVTPTSVSIVMDQWKEAPFYMTDKDLMQAMNGVIPMQASEAIKSLAAAVNSYIYGFYKQVYGFAGAAGTTPFASSVVEYMDSRTVLNKQLAPLSDRRVLLDPAAEGNALKLGVFLQADQRGDQQGVIEGRIGRKLGADWYMDQLIPTHTSTVFTAGAVTVNGVNAIGAGSTDGGRTGTVSIAKATNSSPLVAGDILTIAGDTQTYTVITAVTLIVGNTTVTISPALQKATAGGEAVTLKASHVVNLSFHRDAFAFATRPLADNTEGLGNIIQSMVDPVSGLTLRLEISREHKRTRFSYDILYGAQLIRPELACRIAG